MNCFSYYFEITGPLSLDRLLRRWTLCDSPHRSVIPNIVLLNICLAWHEISCHVLDPTSHYIALTHIRSAIVVGGFWCCCLRRRVLTFREAVVVWFGGLRVSERSSLPSLVEVLANSFLCLYMSRPGSGGPSHAAYTEQR